MSNAMHINLHPSSSGRRQHLLRSHSSAAASGTFRLGEVIGATVAECAVVCCCCPCGLINLLLLAFYKLPAALCRRAFKNSRRRKLIHKGLLRRRRRRRCKCGCDDVDFPVHPIESDDGVSDVVDWGKSKELDEEGLELEKEMWDMFYGTGFWRSSSMRESNNNNNSDSNNSNNNICNFNSSSVSSADSLSHLTSPQPYCR